MDLYSNRPVTVVINIFFVWNLRLTIFFFTWNLSDVSLTLKFRNAFMFVFDLKWCLSWCLGVWRPVVCLPARFHVPCFGICYSHQTEREMKIWRSGYVILPSTNRNTFKKSGSFRKSISGPQTSTTVVSTTHVRVPAMLLPCVGNLKSVMTCIGITHIRKLVKRHQLVQKVKCRAADLL